MFFVKNVIDLINKLDAQFDTSAKDGILVTAALKELNDDCAFEHIESLSQYIASEIRYINTFKNEALFAQTEFKPKHIWGVV